jgi:hypothetical protein
VQEHEVLSLNHEVLSPQKIKKKEKTKYFGIEQICGIGRKKKQRSNEEKEKQYVS